MGPASQIPSKSVAMQCPEMSQSSILTGDVVGCSNEMVMVSLTGLGMIVSEVSLVVLMVEGSATIGSKASKMRIVLSALSQYSTINLISKCSSRIVSSSSSSGISQKTLTVVGLEKLERDL